MATNMSLGQTLERFRADAKKIAVATLIGIPRYEVYRNALDAAITEKLTKPDISSSLDRTQYALVVSYLEQRKEEIAAEYEALLDLLTLYYNAEPIEEPPPTPAPLIEYSQEEIRKFSRDYAAAFRRAYTVPEVQEMYRHIMITDESTVDTYLSDVMSRVEQAEDVVIPAHETGLGWTETLIMSIGYVEAEPEPGE